MSDPRRFELDELAIRPGTYFNPTTEIVIAVDDSAALDPEILSSDDHEAAEWVLISDEVPVDEHARDELIEAFQVHLERGAAGDEDAVDEEENEELEPDEEVE